MRPRVGFLGAGWIGRMRMDALAQSGSVTVAAVADTDAAAAGGAAAQWDAAVVAPQELLTGEPELDGVVIATPSALHAEQALSALDAGMAVFCQKPLGRTAAECAAVVTAAKRRDALLGVDMSYRHLTAVERIRDQLAGSTIGDVFAATLVFHNAYGPDKRWYRDAQQAGGGCVIDLGIHLVDLALWLLGWPDIHAVNARCFAAGAPLRSGEVEDYATVRLDAADGVAIDMACSWYLHAGRDAVIGAALHGTRGGLELCNVGGSFFDFAAYQHDGTRSTCIAEPPDDWGGRAIIEWGRALQSGCGFDERAAREYISVARVVDRIYGR